MKRNGQTAIFWMALIIGLVWSVHSATADLVFQVNRLSNTLIVCGNTWLIQSVLSS